MMVMMISLLSMSSQQPCFLLQTHTSISNLAHHVHRRALHQRQRFQLGLGRAEQEREEVSKGARGSRFEEGRGYHQGYLEEAPRSESRLFVGGFAKSPPGFGLGEGCGITGTGWTYDARSGLQEVLFLSSEEPSSLRPERTGMQKAYPRPTSAP
jgi:hypothetical protein